MKKKILWSIVFLMAALGAGGAFYVWNDKKQAEAQIQTVSVERATIEEAISAQGTLEPKDYVDVGVQVSGQILKLYVDIGDVVQKDQLLAELDPRTYQANIDSSNAEIKSLEAQIKQKIAQADYDRAQLERARKLVKVKAVSQDELEEKEKILKVSDATIESLNAQKEKAEAVLKTNSISLGYTKIYSPMDGIVSDRKANVGQTLNANQTTPTILQVANLGIMTIRAEIAEADVMRLKTGMESTFSTLGELEGKWTGKIRQILPTPTVVNDVVLYNALIDVENRDGRLMNGMSTQNIFVLDRSENVLVIPTKALGERLQAKDDAKGKAYRVQVMRNKIPEVREIRVGLVTRAKAEVTSGLDEGDKVVISGEGTAKKAGGMPRIPGAARL